MQRKQALLYSLIIVPFVLLSLWIMYIGNSGGNSIQSSHLGKDFILPSVLEKAFHSPVATVLLQLIIIVFSAKGLGWLFSRFGQQAVMGEMTAGILLGPSCIGLFFPDVFHLIFPSSTLTYLNILSQLGLMLFMFVIGMELDIDTLRSRFGESLIISHSSIAVPFFLGAVFAYYTFERFAGATASFTEYALFMGIALSITAFPVLARILKERNMTTTPLGSMALISAAINDVTAWCILPIVVAVSKAESMLGVAFTIVLTLVFVLLMVLAVNPLLQRYYDRERTKGNRGIPFIAVAVFVLLVSSLVSEVIGIHALFGAFIAGAVLPAHKALRHKLTERLEDLSVSLLLPVFFALTGLRTSIGSFTDTDLYLTFGFVVLLAVTGKLFGSALAARVTGMNWHDSFTIGVLMNTRGLMELIVLNIGYDLGALNQKIFTILVFMALATTLMTAPMLNLLDRLKHDGLS
jgi:Kef-type K+ transport system membrane component KefB